MFILYLFLCVIYIYMRVSCYYGHSILQLFPHRICVSLALLAGFELRVQDLEEGPRRNCGQSLIYFNVIYMFICSLFLLVMFVLLSNSIYMK